MKMIFLTILGMLTFSSSVFSMGGDKPGPNGGFVKMPGTYHVELVSKKDNILVYLLDLSLKNPISKDSTVALKLTHKEAKKISCKKKDNYFLCNISKNDLAQFKEISIETTRNKIKGKLAIYKLPLKLD